MAIETSQNAPANTPAPANADSTLTTADDPSKIVESPEAKAAAEALAKKATDDAAKTAADAEAARVAALTPEQRETEKVAKEKADADAKAAKVPEKYELKLPDGMTLDPAETAAFETKARELGLSQKAAQELYELGANAVKKNHSTTSEAYAKQIADEQASWLPLTSADKEYGGDKFAESKGIAQRAQRFMSPEFKAVLNQTKLGNHPEFFRFAYRIGMAMSEDGFTQGQQNASRDVSHDGIAKRMYPNQN